MTKKTMLRRHNVICAVSLCIALAACASGGGGGGLEPLPQPQPQPEPQPTPSPQPAYWDTGISGTVGRPARASFGVEPQPAQTATTGGPIFDGSTGSFVASGDSFPVTLSSLVSTSGGLSAVSSNQGATVSFEITRYSIYGTLSIPSLNVTAQLYWDVVDGGLTHLNYVALGLWAEPQSKPGPYGSITAFAFGYETPRTAMPTTGTAAFSGQVEATVLTPVDGSIHAAYVTGTAGFSVDFASGNITGAFTGMTQSDYVSYGSGTGHLSPVTGAIFGWPGSLPWNDVAVTASIAGGTNRFSGSTKATSAPSTTFSLAGSATGYIDGAFYGPNAENLGAIWSLSDGTASALGTVGAAAR